MSDTPFSWDDLTGRWRQLYEEQAKVGQMWFDSQAELAKTLAGASGQAADTATSATALAELWRSGMALGSIGTSLPGLDSTSVANTTLGRMLDPVALSLMGGTHVGEAIRRMTEGPRLADVGSVERRMARVMELYVEVQAATRGYEAVVAGAWMEVNQSFATAMAKRLGGAEAFPPKEALKTWLAIADEVLTRTHRTPEYLEAQRRLLGAGMDFLLAERELVELLVEPAGLPTRTEVDELHRTVQGLKRKVRALEKAADAPKKAPAKRASAKPRSSASGRKASSARKTTEGRG
jgi:polyhydroxyalkanoate synthase subunit PhaE